MSFIPGIGDAITVLEKVISIIRKEYKRRNKYYSIVWKKAEDIKPEKLLKLREYRPFYYEQEHDKQITICLENKENVVIIGKSLIGKTRAAFEALRSIKHPYVVSVVNNVNIEEDFLLPINLRRKRTKIVFIDDL